LWRDYYVLTDLFFNFKTGPLGHKLLFGTDQRFLSTSDRSATDVIEPIDVFNPVYGGLIDPIGPETPRRIFTQSGTFIGIYAQDLVTIIDQVKLLVGGRYDIATSRTQTEFSDSPDATHGKSDDNVFTPRVGLVY
jgi:iron complex outermembrane recepter protein